MGLGVTHPIEDAGGGKEVAVSCSICLDAVTDNGERSWAKLQCGHQFHLDCIGSAFNAKGAMQCPNCRKIEKGQWMYGGGGRSVPEYSMDDWIHDDDLYDFGYSETSFGVHYCPYGPSTYDEGEFPSNSFHDLLGHNPFFFEHTPLSSTSHPCPYVAYIGPIHPSSTSSASVSDGSSLNNHWRGQAVTNEGPSSYAFPTMDLPYNSWYAASNRMSGAEQPSVTQRTARSSSEIQRHGMHPYTFGHSSASRGPSSITSTMAPRFANTQTRPRDRAPSLQAYFHQSASNPPTRAPFMSARRSRNSGTVTPVAPPLDQSGGFYFVSSSSSGITYQEPEIPVRDRFQSWEREQQPSYPVSQVDRDSSIWGPFHPPASGSDAAAMRSGSFRQRNGSSQNRS